MADEPISPIAEFRQNGGIDHTRAVERATADIMPIILNKFTWGLEASVLHLGQQLFSMMGAYVEKPERKKVEPDKKEKIELGKKQVVFKIKTDFVLPKLISGSEEDTLTELEDSFHQDLRAQIRVFIEIHAKEVESLQHLHLSDDELENMAAEAGARVWKQARQYIKEQLAQKFPSAEGEPGKWSKRNIPFKKYGQWITQTYTFLNPIDPPAEPVKTIGFGVPQTQIPTAAPELEPSTPPEDGASPTSSNSAPAPTPGSGAAAMQPGM